MILSTKLLFAYLLDRIFGDPRGIPHPVVFMGRLIAWLEPILRKGSPSEMWLKPIGILYPVLLVGGSTFFAWSLLQGLAILNPLLADLMEVWLISTTIAAKGLADAGMAVYHPLVEGDLARARTSLSMIVGRETAHLDEKEVVRGTVETVAENMVDAIFSPIFYAAIGGAPLAIAYRAANTLDSMVGYKNERYGAIGWASARFDDLVNFIPARITGILILLIAFLLRLNGRGAWKMMRRDAGKHPSPNSGIPEAAVAGALNVRLGGLNRYQGKDSLRAYLGDSIVSLCPFHIVQTVRMMYGVAHAAIILLVLFRFFIDVRLL